VSIFFCEDLLIVEESDVVKKVLISFTMSRKEDDLLLDRLSFGLPGIT
jgi:hypothetical protein